MSIIRTYYRNAAGQITKRDPLVLALLIVAGLAGAVATLAFVVAR